MAPGSTAAAPKLPAKGSGKKSGTGGAAAAAAATTGATTKAPAQFITLPDGTKVPYKMPPGMPKEQAAAVLAYLQANPEAAQAAWAQAQSIMQNRSLTQAFLGLGQAPPLGADPGKSAAIYAALKGDAELQHVFDDVREHGPAALQKYWDDTELMTKISAKLRDMRLDGANDAGDAAAAAAAGGGAGGVGAVAAAVAAKAAAAPPPKGAGRPPSEALASLHDAAKWGDAEAATRLLGEGHDVNGLNERGVSALGVAVGFNRRPMVELLLDAGADIGARDAQQNSVLHYAAGYGRLELVQLLLDRGADAGAVNGMKQRALDVARVNGERRCAELLAKLLGEEEEAAAEPKTGAAAAKAAAAKPAVVAKKPAAAAAAAKKPVAAAK